MCSWISLSIPFYEISAYHAISIVLYSYVLLWEYNTSALCYDVVTMYLTHGTYIKGNGSCVMPRECKYSVISSQYRKLYISRPCLRTSLLGTTCYDGQNFISLPAFFATVPLPQYRTCDNWGERERKFNHCRHPHPCGRNMEYRHILWPTKMSGMSPLQVFVGSWLVLHDKACAWQENILVFMTSWLIDWLNKA